MADSQMTSTVAAASPVASAEDRSMAVPAGHLVRTGYVPVFEVILACRHRMAVGDVDRAYQKRVQLGSRQPWPCPRGHWRSERFVIVNSRHENVATLMLGLSHILVVWIEGASAM